MMLYYKISVNLVSFVFLCIVFYIAKRRLDRSDRFNRLFINACSLVQVALIFESVAIVLNGRADIYVGIVLKILLAFLFSLPPILAYYWFLFGKVLTGDAKMDFVRPTCLIPVLINFVFALLSIFINSLFIVDGDNRYQSGPLYFIVLLATYGYLAAAFILLFVRRSRLLSEEFRVLSFIYLLPALGGALQILLPGTFLMWSLTAGALIVLYVYVQERLIQIDSLTGASTRRSFVQRLNQAKDQCSSSPVGIIFLDIDDFKLINDSLGHKEGDEALRAFATTIKSVLRKDDTLARFGGDEFALLVMVEDEDGLRAVVRKIDAALDSYNRVSNKPYKLRCSIGAQLYERPLYGDINLLLEEVDKMMYEHKRLKKAT